MYNHALNKILQNQEVAQKLTQLVERLMPLQTWGFKQSALFFTKSNYPVAIYDSEQCRVRFLLDQDRSGNSMFVSYGRLHALNDDEIMNWNGNECYCWHRINMALRFLDGISLSQVVEKQYKRPQIIEEFELSELAKGTKDEAERTLFMHASIWEHYGNHLFDLYDLRQPELWERFTQFSDKFHKKINLQTEDKIC